MINDREVSTSSQLFINKKIDKKTLENFLLQILSQFGTTYVINFVDSLKTLGFRYATNGGISISIEDLKIPPDKKVLLKDAEKEIFLINEEWKNSLVTDIERFQKIIEIWNTTSESLKNKIVEFFKNSDPLNSIYMIAFSGARGNISQVKQLVGMRGLMADQKGQIINLPILTNFKEGLSSADYIISSYGARKGIVDTALRTADSGYLTRRLVEIAQDILIREIDCFSNIGININVQFYKNYKENLKGRTLAHCIKKKEELVIKKNKILDDREIEKIESFQIKQLYVRSPITCKAYRAICQYCYGWNLAYQNLVNLGDSVGVIAAQSIGEPGTQMTMRTFHTGGIFTTEISQKIKSTFAGILIPLSRIKATSARNGHGKSILYLEHSLTFIILDWKNKSQRFHLIKGSFLYVEPYTFVKKNQLLGEIPTSISNTKLVNFRDFKAILSNLEGEIAFGDLIVKEAVRKNRVVKYNEKAGLLWILPGKLFSFPNETKLKIHKNFLSSQKTLGKIKISSSKSGFLRYDFQNQEIHILKNILGRKSLLSLIYNCNAKKNLFKIKSLSLQLGNNFYKLKPDFNKNFIKFDFFSKKNLIFQLPKKKISKTNYILFVNTKFSYILNRKDVNLLKNLTHNNGFFFFISNKPWLFALKDLTINQKNEILQESKLGFPGEKIFDSIEIDRLVFYKIIKIPSGRNLLLIFPIYQYQIKKRKNLNLFSKIEKKNFTSKNFNFPALLSHGKNFSPEKLKNFIFYEKFSYSYFKYPFSNLLFDIHKETKNFTIVEEKVLILKNLFNGWILNNLKINFNFLVQNNQYIDSHTILGYIEYKPIKNEKIYLIKKTKADRQYFLFICEQHISKIYTESIKKFSKKQFLYPKNKKLNNTLKLKYSGFFLKQNKNHIILRKAVPYFLTKGAILRHGKNKFVKKGQNFAILINYKKHTEDIIQGLPKIEELIELRGNYRNAMLSEKAGIVCRIEKKEEDYEIEIIEKEYNNLYILKSIENLIVKKFEFINLGEPITSGAIDPHELLRIFCNFYYKKEGILKGLFKSIYKIEQILVNSIQAIYKSQGIDISDKHVEVIVRQMNSQVEVRDSGDSPLIPGESIELFLIEDLCEILFINNYLVPIFQPILMGVTRSALKGESFLSVSSFQETRKMLAEAAIEGKVDWLRSLKANVITGKLIPSGSSFYHYQVNFGHPEFYDLLNFFEYRENVFQKNLKNGKAFVEDSKFRNF